jgi:HME family heavy-metal exporter
LASPPPLLPRALLPAFNEGSIVISLTYQPGISLAQSDALGRVAERLVLAVPEVNGLAPQQRRKKTPPFKPPCHSVERFIRKRIGGCWRQHK